MTARPAADGLRSTRMAARPAAGGLRATTRPRPSARRAADRRAHLLEQEVTLAYIRELAASDGPHPR